MKRIMVLAAMFAVMMVGRAEAALIVGDIQVIGFRADADDALSFVTWSNISAGQTLYFTDSGFFSDGTMRDSENVMSWTAGAGGLAAGSVVVINSPNGSSNANTGTTVGQLDGLSASGDQIFIGLDAFPTNGDTSAPGSSYNANNLLYGFDFNGSAGWDANATSSSTSALPSTLNVTFGNMAVGHVDNGQYTGVRTGLTIDEFKLAIADSGNWTFNNDGDAFGGLNSASFTAVPEPTSLIMVASALGMITLRRRRS